MHVQQGPAASIREWRLKPGMLLHEFPLLADSQTQARTDTHAILVTI